MHSFERYRLFQTNILFNNFVLEPDQLICEELAFTIVSEEA